MPFFFTITLTNDIESDVADPGGRGLEVHPVAVDAALPLEDLVDDEEGGERAHLEVRAAAEAALRVAPPPADLASTRARVVTAKQRRYQRLTFLCGRYGENSQTFVTEPIDSATRMKPARIYSDRALMVCVMSEKWSARFSF